MQLTQVLTEFDIVRMAIDPGMSLDSNFHDNLIGDRKLPRLEQNIEDVLYAYRMLGTNAVYDNETGNYITRDEDEERVKKYLQRLRKDVFDVCVNVVLPIAWEVCPNENWDVAKILVLANKYADSLAESVKEMDIW